MAKRIPEETKNEIVKKYRGGQTFTALAKEYGVNANSISIWARKAEKKTKQLKKIQGPRVTTISIEPKIGIPLEQAETFGKAFAAAWKAVNNG